MTPVSTPTCSIREASAAVRLAQQQHCQPGCELSLVSVGAAALCPDKACIFLMMLRCPCLSAAQEICSSLLLQQLLYYNIFWSVAWCITVGVRVHIKVSLQCQLKAAAGTSQKHTDDAMLCQSCTAHTQTALGSTPTPHMCAAPLLLSLFVLVQYGRGFTLVDPDIARTVLCIFWLLAEPVRLAAGWYGNLQENVRRPHQDRPAFMKADQPQHMLACWVLVAPAPAAPAAEAAAAAIVPGLCGGTRWQSSGFEHALLGVCSCPAALDRLLCHTCPAPCCCLQVPWLVIFGVLTLVPQTAVCYYLMLAAWVGAAVHWRRCCCACCRRTAAAPPAVRQQQRPAL